MTRWQLLLIVLFVGCSSSSKKSVDELVEADFKGPSKAKYNYRQDFLDKSRSETYPLLSDESLARHNEDELEKVLESGNQLDKISAHCYMNDFSEAYKLVDSLYRQYKNHPAYWNSVGICYFRQGNYRKAQLFFNLSLDQKKNYSPAINNIGVIYRGKGEDQKAVELFKQAASSAKFSKTPKFNLAQLYLEYGMVKKAYDIFYKLKKRSPGDLDLKVAIATSFLFQGNYRSAVVEFKKIPSRFYKHDDIGLNYAYALYLKGDRDEAQDIFEDVELKNPRLQAYYNQIKGLVVK
jgi:tetratricopeptide (TPR) repeat protein